jgi:hypothetical protein
VASDYHQARFVHARVAQDRNRLPRHLEVSAWKAEAFHFDSKALKGRCSSHAGIHAPPHHLWEAILMPETNTPQLRDTSAR